MKRELNFSPLAGGKVLLVKALLCLLIFFSLAGAVLLHQNMQHMQVELPKLNSEMAAVVRRTDHYEKRKVTDNEFRQVTDELDVMAGIYVPRPIVIEKIIDGLETVLPSDVYLSNISIARSDEVVHVEGKARTPESFSQLIMQLKDRENFSRVEIVRQYTPPANGSGGVQFELQIALSH